MKWILVLVYVGGLGTPTTTQIQSFTYEKDCRWAALDFMKKQPSVTATCDWRDAKDVKP